MKCLQSHRAYILSNALQDTEFFKSLANESTRNFDDMLSRVEKYINVEEVRKMKIDEEDNKANEKNTKGSPVNRRGQKENKDPRNSWIKSDILFILNE